MIHLMKITSQSMFFFVIWKNDELSVANCLSHSSSSSHIYPSNDKMILLLSSFTEDTDF